MHKAAEVHGRVKRGPLPEGQDGRRGRVGGGLHGFVLFVGRRKGKEA